jgi:thiol-disulfide isomerase/thioredoxin
MLLSCNAQNGSKIETKTSIDIDESKSIKSIYFEISTNEKNKFIWLNVFNKLDDEPTLVKLESYNNKYIDSISSQNEVEVSTSNMGEKCSQSTYRFLPGDSVIFTFDKDNQPIAKIKNRVVNSNELNFFYFLNEKIIGINRYNLQQMYLRSKNKPLLSLTKEESLINTKQFTDSFYKAQKIGDSFYSSVIKQIDFIKVNFFINEKRQGKAQGNISDIDIPNEYLTSSHLLPFLYYRSFLKQYYNVILLKGSLQNAPDYEKGYAIVNQQFHDGIKDYLLFYSILNLKSSNKFGDYLARFFVDCKNEKYIDYIKSNYSDNEVNNNSNLLLSEKKKRLNFDSLISSYKGRVVYIDFWASWCSPCLAEMPTSKKMREQFLDKKIAFIYISTDQKYSDWIDIIPKALLKNYNNSYLLMNSETSSLKKVFNLSSLPKYIIVNKEGKVVNTNAPRPNDPSLNLLLNKLISE